MCYVHNQWYDISCATLDVLVYVESQVWCTFVREKERLVY